MLWVLEMRDSVCGQELGESTTKVKVEVEGKTYYFCGVSCASKFLSQQQSSQKSLLGVILSKITLEIIVVQFELNGIIFALQGNESRALLMTTLAVIVAILALFVGIRNLRLLKTHHMLKRAVLLLGIALAISIAFLVWHFGFHL
jgi:YHS domain-containing protein